MYDHTLHRGRKHFCRYCLQAFSTAEILKSNYSNCFKINGKQLIKMLKKDEYVRFKNYEEEIKLLSMNAAGLESILVLETMGSKILMRLSLTNIKIKLLSATVIN